MAGIPSTTHALTEPGVLIYDRKYGLALDTAALINANYQNHKLNPASPENAFGRSRPYFRTSSRRGRKRKHPTATPAPSHKIRSYMYYDEPFIEEALRRLRELWQRTGRRVLSPGYAPTQLPAAPHAIARLVERICALPLEPHGQVIMEYLFGEGGGAVAPAPPGEPIEGMSVRGIGDSLANVSGISHVIPDASRFIACDVRDLRALLNAAPAGGFDLVVLDPPWRSMSVARSQTYATLNDKDIAHFPVQKLLSTKAWVLVWTTNDPDIHRLVKHKMLKRWRCEFYGVWYWVKTTNTLEPVVPLPAAHAAARKAYEPLIIGRRRVSAQTGPARAQRHEPPRRWVFCAPPPPNRHSSKPQIGALFRSWFVDEESETDERSFCIELFARNLVKDWWSWGNEPLKYQQRRLFVPIGREPLRRCVR